MGEFVSLAQVLEKIVFGNWELGIGNRASGAGVQKPGFFAEKTRYSPQKR